MKYLITPLFLLITNLLPAQIKNGGFENWDSTFTAPYTLDLDTTFGVEGAIGGTLKSWIPESQGAYGISRSSESQSGNYSLLLHNWYSYFNESIRYRDTLSSRPQFLQGHFKYITGSTNGLAQGSVIVALTRPNGNSTDTIATGSFLFDSAEDFTPFQLELNYRSDFNPAYIDIRFTNANRHCMQGNVCHLLFLDNLSLAGTFTGTGVISCIESKVNIFPNPFSSQTVIQSRKSLENGELQVFDAYGFLVLSKRGIRGKSVTIERNSLPTGLYYFRLSSEGERLTVMKAMIFD